MSNNEETYLLSHLTVGHLSHCHQNSHKGHTLDSGKQVVK